MPLPSSVHSRTLLLFFEGAAVLELWLTHGYVAVDLQFADMDCKYYQSAPVINYPNDYEWTRITEFKYFLDE